MEMPNRKYTASSSYRYGFNGKENDNEVKGSGNQQDYGMRIYDSRIAKFLSVDPLSSEFPWNSPYSFAENNAVACIDLEGAEKNVMIYHWYGERGYVLAFNGPPNSDKTVEQVSKKIVLATGLNDDGTLILFHRDMKANTRTNPDETVQASVTVYYDFQYIAKNKEGELEQQSGKTEFTSKETDAVGINVISNIKALINLRVGFNSKNKKPIDNTQANKKLHKNNNTYVGDQAVYEITIDGKLYKFGKADATDINQTTGNPNRLQTQIDKLQKENPNSVVEGKVIYRNGNISTKDIKKIETQKVQEYVNKNGVYPPGNQNHPGVKLPGQ